MSPEINGNPPSVTKRKKKKTPSVTSSENNFDMNMSAHSCRTNNMPDVTTYYSFINSSQTEPLSLPIYNYPNASCCPPPSAFNFVPQQKFQNLNGSSEYLSLPVINQTLESDKRRFSDPGLPNESDSSTNSIDDRIIHKLIQQINSLKENNRRLSREVMELKVEINMMKQQYGNRHWDRDYEPGMLADVIREVRDAARVREDALLARVKHLIEEKQLSLNHLHIIAEKNKNNDRIGKLEEQMKVLSLSQRSDEGVTTSTIVEDQNSSARQVLELERETLVLRRELQDTRAKKEEADQKLAQLDKTLSNLLSRNRSVSDVSEDGRTASIECLSVVTSASSSVSQQPPSVRVTLSGPVTDL